MNAWTSSFLDALDWWLGELRDVARKVGIKKNEPNQAVWTIRLADDDIRIHGAEVATSQLSADANSSDVATLLGGALRHIKGVTVDIQVDGALVLKRQLAPRRIPKRQARAMADLDLLASTPIDPAEIRVIFPRNDNAVCDYFVVKKQRLASVVEGIRLAHAAIGSVRIEYDGQVILADRLSTDAISPRPARHRLLKQVTRSAVVVAAVLAIFTWGHVQWRLDQADRVLDEQIAAVEGPAKAASLALKKRQTEIEQIDKIRADRGNAVSIVRLLAELTRLLPDDVWLTDFSVKGNELTATGYATRAAELIDTLETSPFLTAPEFSAPVTKVPGQTGERFTITVKVGSG